jgi:hypothetical protein
MGATATLLRFVPMGTTATPPTLALLMGTTVHRGLAAVSSSVPVPGSVVVTATDTAASTVIAAGTVMGTEEATATEAVMATAADTVEDTLAVTAGPR